MRLDDGTIEDILANDMVLWGNYTMTTAASNGQLLATLTDGIMPDGLPCSGVLPAGSAREQLVTWVTYVRSQYNARKDKQEAEAARRAQNDARDSSEGTAASRDVGGGGSYDQEAAPKDETPLDRVLFERLTSLRRSLSGVEAEIESEVGRVAALKARRAATVTEIRTCMKALRAIGIVPSEGENI